ncbi:peptide/nickel transport system permease protein [Cytobacillus eiseniae]|uniref:Peptide/nickel transport system permease protein n=1 Tax=Cytobacillus eiseniae TaxID=762947 RepID=A0ABS4RL50_9BACI|nr:ABC transporter permease subunit [Cytobacillus eiseniae]MBP2243161.1 peptide/nickel transport system permease protein [Cytobacillus eiseniae]
MKNYYLFIGLILASFFAFFTFFGAHLPFIDAELSGERVIFPGPGKIETAPFPPSDKFPLGSDREGRDLLSLLVIGAKDTFILIFMIVIIRYIVAIPLGLLGFRNKGFFSWLNKWWNQLFSSLPVIFTTALILCLPFLLFHEHRFYWTILIIALVEVGRVSLIIQEQAHTLSQKTFIEAGITIGVKPVKMMVSHYFPNLMPSIVVNFFIDAGRVAILIGQLAIINVFISQELLQVNYGQSQILNMSVDWGTLIREARRDVISAFWIPFFPMLAIVLSTVTFNILGEGLRQHFNRHTQ